MNNDVVTEQYGSPSISGVLLALLLSVPSVSFAQAIADIDFSTPRTFGYTIGDKIQHQMVLSLRAPYEFDEHSLPETGRLNRWLEISAAAVTVQQDAGVDTYRITIDYQIFNAAKKLTTVTIPQLEFNLSGGPNPLPVFLPEWSFSVAPIATPSARPDLSLQPDRRPSSIATDVRRNRLWISTLLLLGLLAYLAYWRWILPRRRRGRYPFTHALPQLQRLAQPTAAPDHYRLGLRAFHAALNTTAGQVVFDGNLHEFVVENSQYATLEGELGDFFAQSSAVFFDDSNVTSPATALQELVELCRRCQTLERSIA